MHSCLPRGIAAILALVLAGFAGGGPRAAAFSLSLPWPDTALDSADAGVAVDFPSHSPFSLADVGNGAEDDPETTASGRLFLPENASAASPVPAVILLHGAAGVLGARELTYGRQLAARGVAALVIDVFGPRRDRASGFIDRLLNITEAMFLADAWAGLRYLAARPEIDSSRVALIGFSYGGMVTTYAAYAQVAETFGRNGERFAGHIAFYAPCIAEFEDERATGAPLLMIYGGRDAIVDPERCARVAAELEAGGTQVRTVVYENAVHQWDGRPGGERMMGRSIAGCRFIVEPDGTTRDRQLFVPMSTPLLRKAMLGLCADSDGYLIGRDDEVRARSNREVSRFLMEALRPRG
ncbi:MAG: dienelactone hydrolase family protein [Rhodospirillaceae bacterium]